MTPPDPLQSLQLQIQQATVLPAPTPYMPSAEPLDRLRALLRGGDPSNDDSAATTPAADPVGIEAALGREVLAMLTSQPLPGTAREEAARRLLVALQNPTPDNLRSVLRVLVTGRADS